MNTKNISILIHQSAVSSVLSIIRQLILDQFLVCNVLKSTFVIDTMHPIQSTLPRDHIPSLNF